MKISIILLNFTCTLLFLSTASVVAETKDESSKLKGKSIEEIVPDPVFRDILLGRVQKFTRVDNLSTLTPDLLQKIGHFSPMYDYERKVLNDTLLAKNESVVAISHTTHSAAYSKLLEDYPNKTELDLTGIEYLPNLNSLTLNHFKSYKFPAVKVKQFAKFTDIMIYDCDLLPLELLNSPLKSFRTNVTLNKQNVNWLNQKTLCTSLWLTVKRISSLPQDLSMPSVKELRLSAQFCTFFFEDLLRDINRCFPNLEELDITNVHRIYMNQKPMETIAESMPNIVEIICECRDFTFYPRGHYTIDRYKNDIYDYVATHTETGEHEKEDLLMKLLKKLRFRASTKSYFAFNWPLNKLEHVTFRCLPSYREEYQKAIRESFKKNCPNLKELKL